MFPEKTAIGRQLFRSTVQSVYSRVNILYAGKNNSGKDIAGRDNTGSDIAGRDIAEETLPEEIMPEETLPEEIIPEEIMPEEKNCRKNYLKKGLHGTEKSGQTFDF